MNKSIRAAAVSLALFMWGAAPLPPAEEIEWYSMEEAQQLAEEQDKKVLVYAEASWCGYCKKMEKEVFPREEVVQAMDKFFLPVKLDIESSEKLVFNGSEMTGSQFARRHRVSGTPTFFFIDKEGEILGAQPGYLPPDVFEKLLTYVGSDAYNRVKFDDYVKEDEN